MGYKAVAEDLVDEQAYWEFLGVSPEMMPAFLDLRPHWDGRTLWVNDTVQGHLDMWSKIVFVLSYSWRWVTWSDTRWVKRGKTARMFLLSQATGVTGHVARMLRDPYVSH